jgi:DNA (cytosine-5)-methyltransferase 1
VTDPNGFRLDVSPLRVLGLFSGIGGLELGLHKAGATCEYLCELEPTARAVLQARFPAVPLLPDIRRIRSVPSGINCLAAGFPCQDLSQAGQTRGISGARSGLVGEVFRLAKSPRIRDVILENVPFMLCLDRGRAMRTITASLEEMGYKWAYRVLDSRGFGVAQRRRRVFLVASRDRDVERLIFPAERSQRIAAEPNAFGFYWTEGNSGIGWAEDAVPAIKCGSRLGIPSPPAIWVPNQGIFVPSIEDAEALQGFARGWTACLNSIGESRRRWALVGNAVTVPVARWVGKRLMGRCGAVPHSSPLNRDKSWPTAGFGQRGLAPQTVACSESPLSKCKPLLEMVIPEMPLSERATRGFLSRLQRSNLRRPQGFETALSRHAESLTKARSLQEVRA